MLLDELVEVIETLQKRISAHRESLRQNETRTRTALIDPLLAALGWNPADPSLVTPEYNVGQLRADYALLGHANANLPAATVEAKKLEEGLQDHRMQMLNYANMSGINYAGLTDGNHWELYRVFQPGTLEERRILDVTLTAEPAHQCALTFLLLWRPNLASGQPSAAAKPLWNVPEQQPAVPEEAVKPERGSPIDDEWQSLANLQPQKGLKPPSALRFPGEGERVIGAWLDVLVEVAEWQIRMGRLTPDKCPIWSSPKTSRTTRYIIHTIAKHSNGKEFEKPRELTNHYFLEAHGRDWAQKNSKGIVKQLGGDPATILLKFN